MKEYIINSLNFKGNDYDEVKKETYKGEEIVRCKNCKYGAIYDPILEEVFCTKTYLVRKKKDYCSMGKDWLDERGD